MDRDMRKILLLVVCLLMPAALVAQEDNDSTGYERDITLSEAIGYSLWMLPWH